MSDDLVKRLRDVVNYYNSGGRWAAADRIEELDDIIRHDRERIEELVSMVNSKDARIEELEAKIRAYFEANADAAGGAPDQWKARQKAYLNLRASVDWPTKSSADTARAALAELKREDRG
jgi:chromosome segregation ATPase